MGNHISHELSSSLGTDFISQLDPDSRRKALATHAGALRVGAQFAMSSEELRVAVERAREAGACVVQRAVRMNVQGQSEVRELWSEVWRALGSPRTARIGSSFTCVGSAVYLIGGYSAVHRILDSVEVLDTTTGTWSTAAPIAIARNSHSCTLVGDLLYVIGGYSVSGKILDSVEVLDTTTGTWSTAAPLATSRYNQSCTLVGDLLYVIGGKDAGCKSLDSVEVLDTTTGTWSTAAPLATARCYHSCTLVGDLLYVVDGYDDKSVLPLDSVEALDTVTGTWSTLEPDAIPPEAVAESMSEVLCEYTEQPSTSQAAKAKSKA